MQTPRKPFGKKQRKEWRKERANQRKEYRDQLSAREQILNLRARGIYAGREIERLWEVINAA